MDLIAKKPIMNAEQCRAMARECYQLARDAPEPDVRRRLLHLAVKWRELANAADKEDWAILADRPERSKLH
jgi:hypothetical protein